MNPDCASNAISMLCHGESYNLQPLLPLPLPPHPKQDTFFQLRLDEYNAAWGVFDGHGSENGTLVAEVACASIEKFLKASFHRLRSEPEEAMTEAFGQAHQAVIAALQKERPEYEMSEDGYLFEEWHEQDGTLCAEACDGGTTATVVALVDGYLLVQAQCGDSTALLGGMMEAEPTFEELIGEHSATNADEFARVQATRRGKDLQFVYDVPELIDEGKAPMMRSWRGTARSAIPAEPARTTSPGSCPLRTIPFFGCIP